MEKQIPFRDSDEQASIFEHLMRAAQHLANNRGQHGLCLFGDGDWTDPINGPSRKGAGESTWTTCALGVAVQMLQEVAESLRFYKFSMTLTVGISGVILAGTGFDVVKYGKTQPPEVLERMLAWYVFLPMVVWGIALILLYRYKLTRAAVMDVRSKLEDRRGVI